MPRATARRRALRLVSCAALACLASAAARATAVREPCTPDNASGEKAAAIVLDPAHPAAFANWNVRHWQRHRVWITLVATNTGDAPATILPQVLLDARPDGGAAWQLTGRPVAVAPHAAASERLSVWLPDDTRTLGVRLGEGGGTTVTAAFSHECSEARFDAGTLAVPAAALLKEALAIYLDGYADPVGNPHDPADTALRQATGAQDGADVAWALRAMMESLRDDHGFVGAPGEVPSLPPAPPGRAPAFEWLPEGVAVVRVHGGDAGGAGLDQALAEALHDGVSAMAARHPLGWIVDLRGNGGDTPWPSLAGLSSLLAGPVVGASVGRTGHEDWIVERGAARIAGSEALIDLQSPPEPAFDGPLAVLVDENTSNEGELVAVAFQGRPHTRFFGSRTAGCPAWCMRRHALSDGTILGVLERRPADRTGRVQREPITPETLLKPPVSLGDTPREAVDWLLEERRGASEGR